MSKIKEKKRPSRIKFILNGIKNNFISEKQKNSACKCGQDHSNDNQIEIDVKPMQIALVVDGVVEDIIYCNERLGLLLLSNPHIVETEEEIAILWNYNEKLDTFEKPEEILFHE